MVFSSAATLRAYCEELHRRCGFTSMLQSMRAHYLVEYVMGLSWPEPESQGIAACAGASLAQKPISVIWGGVGDWRG